MAQDSKKKSLLLSGISLSFFTLCSRVLGLVREMTKASFLGTSKYADAFVMAFMIPNLFRRLFAENAISVAFIPTFRGYLEDSSDEGIKKTKEFVKATLTLVTFLTTLVVVIGIIVIPYVIPLFKPKVFDETVILTRIMFPYLIVISIAAFFQGVLNGVKIFSPSGFTPVLFNSIVIGATYLLAPLFSAGSNDPEIKAQMAARAMSVGVIAGGCVQALFQLPFVIRVNWWCGFASIKKAFTNPGTRKVVALVGPTILGMAAYQLNDVVSTALASGAGEGIVSSLQYSLRLQELILGIFAVSIGTVILPDLSGLAKSKKWDEFNVMLLQAIRIIAFISIPVTFLSLVTGKEIISLVYKNKSFDEESVRLTLSAFRWHIAGLFFIAMNRIISPAFYAQGNTKSPALAGILGFAVNILLAVILVHPMSGGGIALALSPASVANSVLLFLFFRKNPSLDVKCVVLGTFAYSLKLCVFSVVASVPAWFVRNALTGLFSGVSRIIEFGVPLFAAAFVYAVIGITLLVISKDSVVGLILRRFTGRRN